MSSSRSRLREAEKPTNSSKGKGLILETPYRPGFVDDKDLETVKMAVDKELSDISNAFYQTTERTADTITRIDKLEITGETQYGELVAKIETVDKVSKEGDEALASRITTFEAKVDNEFGETKALITQESEARSSADEAIVKQVNEMKAEIDTEIGKNTALISSETQARVTADEAMAVRIDNILGSMEGELGPLVGQIQSDLRVLAKQDEVLATKIDTVTANYEQADRTIGAAIQDEITARVTADEAMTQRVNGMQASIDGVDGKIAAAIKVEETARVTEDSALASRIDLISVEIDGKIGAAVGVETDARVEADKALASQITTVKAELDGEIAQVKQFAEVEITGTKDLITKEEADRLAAQAILDGKITKEEADRIIAQNLLDGKIKANEDAISLEEAQRLADKAVLEGKISQEEADRLIAQGVLQGNINATNGAVNQLNAKWGVELDVNGKISGVIMNNNGARSNFEVRADLFRFTDTSGGLSGGFSSSGGVTTFNGIIHADGGYFNNATVNGVINAHGGDFRNVRINEDCIILGTLYADRIVGLPTTQRFYLGETTVPGSVGGEWHTMITIPAMNSHGRFDMMAMLGGRPQIKSFGQPAGLQVRVLINGGVAYYTNVYSSGASWTDIAALAGIPFNCGGGGGTIEIQVQTTNTSHGGYRFQFLDGCLYSSIGISAFW